MAGARGSLVFRVCVATGVLAAVLLSSPTIAQAEEPTAPEVDANPATAPLPSVRTNLILVGAAVTAGWYGAAYGTSYLWPAAESAPSLRIPVAGPYIALVKTPHCASGGSDCGTLDVVVRTILTSLSAIGQTGGVLAMLEGVFVPTSAPPRSASRKVNVAITPAPAGANGLGFGVFGEF